MLIEIFFMSMFPFISLITYADFKSAADNAETIDSIQRGSDIILNLTILDSGFVLVPVEENTISCKIAAME